MSESCPTCSAIRGPSSIAAAISSASRRRTLRPWSHGPISSCGSLRPSASSPRRQARDAEAVLRVQLAETVEEADGLVVRDDVWMDLLLGAELGQARDRVADVALLEERDQLVAQARAREVADVAGGDALAGEPGGVLVHAEAVAVLVADRAEDARRVVDERAVVEDADAAGLEVGAAAERVDELADCVALERDGHRVDREVAAVEVLVDRAGLDARAARPARGTTRCGP